MKNLIVVCFSFLVTFALVDCVLLGKSEGEYLRNVVKEFESSPKNGRFDRIVEASYAQSSVIPKVFIWCPVRHYGITVLCPFHGCPLKVGQWTDLPDP